MKVLKISSSILGENSVSDKQLNEIAEKLKAEGHEIISKNLGDNPVSLFNKDLLAGFNGNADFAHLVKEHQDLIDEVLSVDMLLIGAPMYNFNIPVQLKAYFDAISRAGITFKYTETGPVGLLKAKKAIVVFSSGGIYTTSGYTAHEDYLKMQLKFLGIENLEINYVEGIAVGNIVHTKKSVTL